MRRVEASSRSRWVPGIAWLYFAVLFLLLFFTAFLWKSGEYLVRSDSFGHIRWALVLAGETNPMDRSKAALTLFQEGRIDSLILSGPRVFRTHHESEFTEEWLLSKGFPKDRIFQLPHDARSTQEEAEAVLPQIRLLGIDTLLVITSNFHTARSARIFQRLAGSSPVIKIYAAEDPDFDPKTWWASRTSRSIWVVEWLKTLHTGWELLGQKALTGVSESSALDPNPRLTGGFNPPLDSSLEVSHPDTLKTDTGKNIASDTSIPQDTVTPKTSPEKPRLEKSKPGKRKRRR